MMRLFHKGTVQRLVLAAATMAALAACTPTIRVEVAPINIYAKLDADVRVRLDKEVQSAIQQNPDLF
jgi:hypothetical protein